MKQLSRTNFLAVNITKAGVVLSSTAARESADLCRLRLDRRQLSVRSDVGRQAVELILDALDEHFPARAVRRHVEHRAARLSYIGGKR